MAVRQITPVKNQNLFLSMMAAMSSRLYLRDLGAKKAPRK
jgi:hypothetical protein